MLSEQKWLGHASGIAPPFQEPKQNMQPGMPAEPVSGPAGKKKWKQERSQVAGTAFKRKDLLWVHLLHFFQVCSFYPQQGGTKDRGSPAFRQKKGCCLSQLITFKKQEHLLIFTSVLHLGVNSSLSAGVKCCWPGECLGSVQFSILVSLYCTAWVLSQCGHFCLSGMRLAAEKLMKKTMLAAEIK